MLGGGGCHRELCPGWAAGSVAKPPAIRRGPAAVARPEHEVLALTTPVHPNPLAQVDVKGAGGGDALPPTMTAASQGGQGTLAAPAFPGSLSAICAGVVKGVN